MFPLAPLSQAVATAGGLTALLLKVGAGSTTYNRLTTGWVRAQRRGTVGWSLVDEVCCTLLSRHPSELYGRDWFDDVTFTLLDEQDIDEWVTGIDPLCAGQQSEVAA